MKSAIIKALALVGVAAGGTAAALHVQGNVSPPASNAFADTAKAETAAPVAFEGRPTLASLAEEADNRAAAADPVPFPAGESVPAVRGQNAEPTPADELPVMPPLDDAPPVAAADEPPEPTPASGDVLLAQFDGSDPFAAGPAPAARPDRTSTPRPADNPFGDAPPPLAPQADASPIGRADLGTLRPEPALPEVRPMGEPVADSDVQPAVGYDIRPQGGERPASNILPVAGEEFDALPADDSPFAMDLSEPPARPAPAGGADPFAMERTAVVPPGERPVVPRNRREVVTPEEPVFDFGGEPSPLPAGGPVAIPEPNLGRVPVAEPPAPNPAAFGGGMTQDLGVGPKPSQDEFVGDGVIDRNVARGPVRPQLEITKQAPERAAIGEKLVYSITVTNTGNTPARSVVVEDRIPRGSTLDGTNPVAEMPQGNKALIWKFEEIGPGQSQRIQVRVIPTQSGSIGSIATVRFVAETAAETRIAAPQLKFELVGPAEAQLGETVKYQFKIANTGDGDAQDVLVRTLVPEGLKHPGGVDLEYPVGTLPAGAERTVDLPVTAVAVGEGYQTRATLESRGGGPIDSVRPIRVIKSRLDIGRSGPGKRIVNSDVSFVNRVTNTSIKTLTNVRVTETLPPGTKFVSATAGGRARPGGNIVEWVLPRLGPGESQDVSVKFKTGQAGTAESIVSAVATDGSQAGIRAKMEVIGFAALKVDADHPNRPIAKGEQVSMRMVIRNGGTAAARNVATTIQIPPELKLVSVNSPVKYRQVADSVQFDTVGAIGMGDTVEVDLIFDAVGAGDGRVRVTLQSADLQSAMVQDESFRVY